MEVKEEINLSAYLKENQDVLTALGVFVALTMLAGNLTIKIVSLFISFASFSCTTFILVEIWTKRSNKRPSMLLSLFKWALSILAISYLVYWFVMFDLMVPGCVGIIIGFLLAGVTAWILRKLNRKAGKVIAIVLVIAIFIVSIFLGNLIKAPIYEMSLAFVSISTKLQGSVQ